MSGNGHIGANVYGGVQRESVIITHSALWSGKECKELPNVSDSLKKTRQEMDNGEFHKAQRVLADELLNLSLIHIYRIRSTGTTSPITYTKIAFEEIAQQYAVKVSDNILNGTVTVDKEQATEDDIVTITATPLNKNFEVDTISVTGTNGADIEVSNNGDDTYTFTMPNQAVTINATFKASVEGNIESIKIGDMPEYIAIPSNESKNINVPIIVTDEYGGVVSVSYTHLGNKESVF